MTATSAVVAVGFGLLVGWGLAGYDRRPAVVALLCGMLAGGSLLVAGYGPDPSLGGGSLLLGCGAALPTVFLLHRD